MKISKENRAKHWYDFEAGQLLPRQPQLSEFIKNRINVLEYITVFKCVLTIPQILKIYRIINLEKMCLLPDVEKG